MELLGDVGHVESQFGPFGDGVSVVQDRCTVCAKRTIGLVIVLDATKVLLGDKAQVEARFGPFRDSAKLDVRWVHGLCQTYHRL
jgi:hypothetical protein